jgi:sugar phosphate isomerase/epimerase
VHWSKTLSDPDAAVRAAGRAALEGALRDARRYGTDSVLLVPAVVNAKVSYAEAWERSTAEIRQVLPLAAETKVHVSIENVWNNFLLSPLEAARYVDQFESPWVGWHLDIGNIVLLRLARAVAAHARQARAAPPYQGIQPQEARRARSAGRVSTSSSARAIATGPRS